MPRLHLLAIASMLVLTGCPDVEPTEPDGRVEPAPGRVDRDDRQPVERPEVVVMPEERRLLSEAHGRNDVRATAPGDGFVYAYDLNDGRVVGRMRVARGEEVRLNVDRARLEVPGSRTSLSGFDRTHAHQLVYADHRAVDDFESDQRYKHRRMSQREIDRDLADLADLQKRQQRRDSQLNKSAEPTPDAKPDSKPDAKPPVVYGPPAQKIVVPKSAQILVKESNGTDSFTVPGRGRVLVWDLDRETVVCDVTAGGNSRGRIKDGRLTLNDRQVGNAFDDARRVRIYFVPPDR